MILLPASVARHQGVVYNRYAVCHNNGMNAIDKSWAEVQKFGFRFQCGVVRRIYTSQCEWNFTLE